MVTLFNVDLVSKPDPELFKISEPGGVSNNTPRK